MNIDDVIKNPELHEVARKAVEDVLVDLRDSRISLMFRNNGLVIREKDGSESSLIRLGFENAFRIGLEAVAAHVAKTEPRPEPKRRARATKRVR